MICDFRGKYRFLSNFYMHGSKPWVILDGVAYPSVEHAYQAAKSDNPHYRTEILTCTTPGSAKRLGQKIHLRWDWEDVKLQVMKELLLQKFVKGSELAQRLLDTGSEELIEANVWRDVFWGQCPLGNGLNWLGRLLMEIRNGY